MLSVLNGQKGTPVYWLHYLRLTVVTLMTTVNNVHASSSWFLTVGPLAHVVALSFLALYLILLGSLFIY